MPDRLTVTIDDSPLTVASGTTVAAAMLIAGVAQRTSVTGEPRAALCGMGICFECRATVDGVSHQRTCQLLCRQGMRIEGGMRVGGGMRIGGTW